MPTRNVDKRAKKNRRSLTMVEPFWSTEERQRLGDHFMKLLKHLVGRRPVFLLVVPESMFVADPRIRIFKGSTQGGWSVWIRETWYGLPYTYNDYLETVIHEGAHVMARDFTQGHGPEFDADLGRLRAEASKLGLWPRERVPKEVATLFSPERRELRMEQLRPN